MRGALILSLALLAGCASGSIVVSEGESPARTIPPGHVQAAMNHVANGKKQLRMGHTKQAQQQFEKALEKDPNNVEARYYLGSCAAYEGNYREARDHWSVAVSWTKDGRIRSRIEASTGVAFLLEGDDEAGRTRLKAALELDPGNRFAREELAHSEELARTSEPGRRGHGRGKHGSHGKDYGYFSEDF